MTNKELHLHLWLNLRTDFIKISAAMKHFEGGNPFPNIEKDPRKKIKLQAEKASKILMDYIDSTIGFLDQNSFIG